MNKLILVGAALAGALSACAGDPRYERVLEATKEACAAGAAVSTVVHIDADVELGGEIACHGAAALPSLPVKP